jgi:argininosuccinate synthase
VRLYKGTTAIAGRSSRYSLYSPELATYTSEDTFDHKASEGFITIYGLPVKTYHQVQASGNGGGKKTKLTIKVERV